MNRRQYDKVRLFFSGFEEKFEQGRDYFERICWKASSGRREYEGDIIYDADAAVFKYSFAGNRTFDNMQEMFDVLADTLVQYDSAEVDYIERGRMTSVIMDGRGVRLEKKDIQPVQAEPTGLKNKSYHLDLAAAAPLLKQLGFLTDGGKIKNDMIRKYNQTDRFLDLIGDMFEAKDKMTIVDCACGKSYLSFILNYYLWEKLHIKADFTGIDIKPEVIESSAALAEKLGYRNMRFICQDLRTFDGVKPDTVISLHACDTATDMALGYAIRNGAENIICIPCCHKELLDQYRMPGYESLLKHGVFRTRMNDILTDALRCLKLESCGYKVSCVEYCSPLDTPKNLLIKARRTDSKNPSAEKEYRRLLSELHVRPSIEYYSQKN